MTKVTVNRNIQEYLKELAETTKGQYTQYSDDSVILTLPMGDGRYQNVKAFVHDTPDGIMLIFMSKVCHMDECTRVNTARLLELNAELVYAKMVLDRGYYEVQANTKYELCTLEQVRFMVHEVAKTADSLEKEFTGEDRY